MKAIVAAALMVTSPLACRRAASLILDLPATKEPAAGPATGAPPASATGSANMPAAAAPASAVEALPPIEGVRNRDSVLALLPRDKGGRVDWVAAVRQAIVRPRAALPNRRAAAPLTSGFDFFYKSDDAEYDTSFPHSSHTLLMDCRSCHPSIYRYRGMRSDMEKIDAGEGCGVCHRTVAFNSEACYRCHPAQTPDEAKADLGVNLTLARDSAAAADQYPPASFPHWVHRIRYRCSACHPDEFAMKAGSAKITMAALEKGAGCGACHDGKTAFGLVECARCHLAAAPKPSAP